jgi:hypothetical protein
LPQRLPGSFKLTSKKGKEDLKIVYTLEAYVEGMRWELLHEKELIIK